MKQLDRLIGIFLFLIIVSTGSQAQNTSASLPLTADSLATGNYKDVFKSFFQLAFNRFISSEKEIQFTANPFAVMAKMNPNLLVDTNYIKYKGLRNLNFSFSGKLDADYKFNGFSSGIKYALVNKRDETVSRLFVNLAANSNREVSTLNSRLNGYLATIPIGEKRNAIRAQVNQMFRGELVLGQLDTALQERVKEFMQDLNIGFDSQLNIRKLSQRTYDSLKTLFQKRPLWTIGISDTTYQNKFLFSNVVFTTEFVKGIVNPARGCNVELNTSANLQLADDSLRAGKDLKRSVFNFEPGLNLVLKVKGTQQSFLEFKLSGSYNRIFSTLYAGEERNQITINSNLRIRILNDIWIPLEIKYDPKTGNIFGFLNVRANFTGVAKSAAGKS